VKKALPYTALGLLALLSVFPLLYIVTNSFMGAEEFARYYGALGEGLGTRGPFHLLPDWLTLDGYREVFYSRPDYLGKFWVSLLLSGTILAGQLVVSVLGGYAFARFRFPGRDAVFFVVVLLLMLPLQVTLVPNYIVLEAFGLIGDYWALLLPGMFSAFGVFLMRQVMTALPAELFEAARLDGAGAWRSLWRICLPNCKPGLAALAVLSFADSWNMVEQPLVFLRDAYKYPMSVFLTQVNSLSPEVGFVCGILSVLPALALFLHYKDEMVLGIEYSAVK
jgi:multiple sugar transport system permease protein